MIEAVEGKALNMYENIWLSAMNDFYMQNLRYEIDMLPNAVLIKKSFMQAFS